MLKLFNMKLQKKISTKHFILSQILILTFGLIFLGVLYYILNIQYQTPKNLFLNGPVTMPPKTLRLDLSEPEQESLVFSDTIPVVGKTSPDKKILIFTDSNDKVIRSNDDGNFAANIDLDEGENKITVVVFDVNGDSRSAERSVYYSKEKI